MKNDPDILTACAIIGWDHPILLDPCDFGRCGKCIRCLGDRLHQEKSVFKRAKIHRGHEIGWMHAIMVKGKRKFRGCYRAKSDLKWTEICILEDSPDEAIKCAIECVDYRYRVDAFESERGRKYDPVKDGPLPENA